MNNRRSRNAAPSRSSSEPIVPVGEGQKLIYLEAENVSCAPCGAGAGWTWANWVFLGVGVTS